MSNKSGIASQVIALPQGGGAQQGIGERFTPDLHKGTGNFTVPLTLPPGRNGFQPNLSLVYSSGSGNGPFGLGWSLSIPGVSRKTSSGVPQYHDRPAAQDNDTFILSGWEDLVALPGGGPGVTRYRPRVEGLFARIEHRRGTAGDFWEVRSRDGLVSQYGTPKPVGAGPAWRDPATVADPDVADHIFSWKLTSTTDPFGNRIEYRYERDASPADGPHRWDQCYLTEIRYADHSQAGYPFLVSVRFVYETRLDPFSDYRSGFEIRTVRRCIRIEISTHAGAPTLVRSYDLAYLDQLGLPPDQLPANGVSLLSRIHVVGYDGPATQELPPLDFGYTLFEPTKRRYQAFPADRGAIPDRSLGHPDYALVDLFGCGLPDVVQLDGNARYWRNRGGVFDLPRSMPDTPTEAHLARAGVQIADMNGDGRSDLLITDGLRAGYYSLGTDGGWDRRSYVHYPAAPSVNLEDSLVRLVDLDGDGVVDALRTAAAFEMYFHDRRRGWERLELRARDEYDEFPNVSFSDPTVKLADMNGDQLQDIVRIHNGHVDYWPYMGRGRWGQRIGMANSPQFEDAPLYGSTGYDPRRLLLGDVDGDGLTDLVYVGAGHVTVWINQSGNHWSDPITISGTPMISDLDAVRLADMHGTGTAGILWTYDYTAQIDSTYKFLDLTGGGKPYLLNRMDNHLGATTLVEYAASTHFYLEDERDPQTRWQTTLPFPVQVVARVEVIDQWSQGKLTTDYHYRHGYWDGAEREFCGFGMVEQRDTETFARYNDFGLHGALVAFNPVGLADAAQFSPPTVTRTWFHQGPVGEEFGSWAEFDCRQAYWRGDPPALLRPLATTALLRGLPRRARRDALRALRGRVLRTELYARDESARQDRPYTVREYQYGLREETPPSPADPERRRIFFPHLVAERVTQWERGSEPLTQLAFSEGYDGYGQPQLQISIAVPRGRDFRQAAAPNPSAPYLATYTHMLYAQRDTAQVYIVDRVARTEHYEILNDARDAVFTLHDAIVQGLPAIQQRLIEQTLNFYDGPAFTGLPFRQIGTYGALVRVERLVLTPSILSDSYADGVPAVPAYMQPAGLPPRPADYPSKFWSRLVAAPQADPTRPGLAIVSTGHGYAIGGPEYANGYFVASDRRRYDFHESVGGTGRGLVMAKRDALDRETTIIYDRYDLLPAAVTDPAQLTTRVVYDYRVLLPATITDPNDNQTRYAYTPLGLLMDVYLLDKAGQGDAPGSPNTRYSYDFAAQMIAVMTTRRIHHAGETDVPVGEQNDIIVTVEYSDGFGRLIQTRMQAQDLTFGDETFGNVGLPTDQLQLPGTVVGHRPPAGQARVVVSGWQIYDNKGRVVEKYEPFFDIDWVYAPPSANQNGQKVKTYYDPRGRVVHIVNPDGSEQWVVYGVPGSIAAPNLSDPTMFEPTAWESYTYDANDNAGRTHHLAAAGYQSHWNTPTSTIIDALGRVVMTVRRNGPNPADWYTTRSTYDIRGNLLMATDAVGRTAMANVYDLFDRALRREQIDAGIRRLVLDAAGNSIEMRDGKAAVVLRAYDALDRPTHTWARDHASGTATLRERYIYGDSLLAAQAKAANLANRLYQQYDEAGLVTLTAYDFKGNVLEKERRVIANTAVTALFNPPPPAWQVPDYQVEWQPPTGVALDVYADTILEAAVYQTSLTYDALNRVKRLTHPQDSTGARREMRSFYNRAGALASVTLDGVPYVRQIAYNARGQRTLVIYGNDVMTLYAYDPLTFRLARQYTTGYSTPAAENYQPRGQPLQDVACGYDLAGNMLAMRDRTLGAGLPVDPNRLDRAFTYDPLYRLRSATGRECANPSPSPPWADAPRCHDVNQTRAYTEQYTYDPVGNLTYLIHMTTAGNQIRDLSPVAGGNRLATMTASGTPYGYGYDGAGNMTAEGLSRSFTWSHADKLIVYRTQTVGAEPTIYARYFYDASGQRVKKLVRRQGGQIEVTVYLDGVFEHRWISQGGPGQENAVLHILDGAERIALVRTGAALPGDVGPAVQYHLGDHLGSSVLVVGGIDATASAFINREEYYPYGETSFGSFAKKRYRFTAKERDEESGLSYHGARYYAPWLGRWVSCDPVPAAGSPNLYRYAASHPLRFRDSTGAAEKEPGDQEPEWLDTVLHGIKSFVPGPNKNTVVRRDDFSPNPETYGFKPSDPTANLSPAEHALNQHQGVSSPYVSASRLPKGAETMVGERFWIDIDKARAAGAEFIDHPELVAQAEKLAAENPAFADRVPMWKNAQPSELEVLFKGEIPAGAIESGGTRALKCVGKGLGVAGTVVSVYQVGKAGVESYETGSPRPLVEESVRQVGGWTGAMAGAEAGTAIGAALGIETGPGAVVTGLIGGVVGGVAGSLGANVSIEAVNDTQRELSRAYQDIGNTLQYYTSHFGRLSSPAGPW